MLFSKRVLCFALAGILLSSGHKIVSACQDPNHTYPFIRLYDHATNHDRVQEMVKENHQEIYGYAPNDQSIAEIMPIFTSPGRVPLVLMYKNAICGFIVYSRGFEGKETKGYIGLLAVDSTYRKRNFGKQLLDEAQKNLATVGCSSFFLRCQNRKAFDFFTKCGFQMVPGTEKQEYTIWSKENPSYAISACQGTKNDPVTLRAYCHETDQYPVSQIIKDNYQHLYYEEEQRDKDVDKKDECEESEHEEYEEEQEECDDEPKSCEKEEDQHLYYQDEEYWDDEQEKCGVVCNRLINRCLCNPKKSSLVLLVKDKIVGFVVFRPKIFKGLKCSLTGQKMGYIQLLAVDRTYRQRGLGRILLETAQKELRKKGCTSFFLNCFNPDSFSFYEKCGFRRLNQEISADNFTTWYKDKTWQDTLVAQLKPAGLLLGGLIAAYLAYSYS